MWPSILAGVFSMQLSVPSQDAARPAASWRGVAAALWLLVLLGSLLRLWEVWQHNPLDHIWSDPQRHWDAASKTLEASPMAVFDPPLYQLWLSLVQKLSLGSRELIGCYVGLLSIATPWLWYRFLREALSSRLLALGGWAVLVWLPTWIGIYSYFMTETLLLPLLGASLWQTLRADRRRSVGSFVGMAVLWMLTGLTRAIALPLGALACLLVWIGHPARWRAAAWSVFVAVLIMAPLGYRNYHSVRLWAPWGNSWLTSIYAESGKREIQLRLRRDAAVWTYGFTTPAMDRTPFEPFSDWTPSRRGTVLVDVDLNAGARDWRAALTATAVHGPERLRLRLENLIDVLSGDSWPDNNRAYLMGAVQIEFRWVWLPLFLLVIAWSARRWRATLRRPLLPALITLWFLVQAVSLLSVNEGRYRKPFEGLLIAQLLVLVDQRRRRHVDERRGAVFAAPPADSPIHEA
jgi:hypothetical protein